MLHNQEQANITKLMGALKALRVKQARYEATVCPRCGKEMQTVWIPSMNGLCFICEECAKQEVVENGLMILNMGSLKPITEWAFGKDYLQGLDEHDINCPDCGKKIARRAVDGSGGMQIKCHGCKTVVEVSCQPINTKVFEVRDRATRIDVMATVMVSHDETVRHYMRHAGFGEDYPLVMVTRLNDAKSNYDAYKWDDMRTMHEAHLYIQDNFFKMNNGDVVDVEYIKGEKPTPKVAERFDR